MSGPAQPDKIFTLHPYSFEWNQTKAKRNVKKHRVSFLEGATVFLDPQGVILDDLEHSGDEERFLLIGYSQQQRILVVVHAERGRHIRIISARAATPTERRDYEEFRR